jgi:hypothetical protein
MIALTLYFGAQGLEAETMFLVIADGLGLSLLIFGGRFPNVVGELASTVAERLSQST